MLLTSNLAPLRQPHIVTQPLPILCTRFLTSTLLTQSHTVNDPFRAQNNMIRAYSKPTTTRSIKCPHRHHVRVGQIIGSSCNRRCPNKDSFRDQPITLCHPTSTQTILLDSATIATSGPCMRRASIDQHWSPSGRSRCASSHVLAMGWQQPCPSPQT